MAGANQRQQEPAAPRSLISRLQSAAPDWYTALIGGMAWGAAMAANARFGLWLQGWQTPDRIATVVLLYALGGMLAFPVGMLVARFLSEGRDGQASFSAAFLSFTVATLGITALLYTLIYWRSYAGMHAEVFSPTWALQLIFTTLFALYQFASLGLRLYLPFGFIALFAASFWFVRRMR